MQNTHFRTGPVALGTAAANILSPPTLTGGVGIDHTKTYLIVKHIRVINTTGSSIDLSLYIGATGGSAAGTEVGASAVPVAAHDVFDFYVGGGMRIEDTEFLTGKGSAVGLTLSITGEIGITP